ncbi:hypothetical protein [Streptomyces californicus]|uniref:hypothetical protein n=1 Tax=Streptomyces californicus TaxID=67351 RepID=UPI000AEFDD24|nr:hypothetical protein [Streptomyces californicus]QRV56647.1 hypothetical protein I6J40_22435 [Streptomyces californicus]
MTGLAAVIAAAIDDYRTEVPAEQQTPAGLTNRITEYLASSGYPIALDTGSPT